VEGPGYWASLEATVLPVACLVEPSGAFLVVFPEAFPVVILEVLLEVLLEAFLAAFLEELDLDYRRQDRHKREEDWGCCSGSWYWAGVPVC
jgi:hypothetical protein